MAKQLAQADLDALLNSIEEMTPEQLAEEAKKVAALREERKAKHEAYRDKLSPEKRAAQYEKMKTRNQIKRAREKVILDKAKELGLIS